MQFSIVAATQFYLRNVHGWDGLSALIASSPGALSQSLAMAIDMKANAQGIIIVQDVPRHHAGGRARAVLELFGLMPAILGSGAVPAAAPLPLLFNFSSRPSPAFFFIGCDFPAGFCSAV